MKGKVLFIDYVYQKGHVNFNRIHIDAIRSAGYDVKIVLHSDIASQLDYPDSDYVAKLPRFLNMRGKRAVLNRIIFTVTPVVSEIQDTLLGLQSCSGVELR